MAKVLKPVVFIIESPGKRDIVDGRSEGEALSSALRLGNIHAQYCKIDSFEMLQGCMDRIASETTPHIPPGQTDTFVNVPHFHFSAHGNEQGIGLTNGDFVDWKTLRHLLLAFAKQTGYVSPRNFGLFPAIFSTCNGADARKMFAEGPPYPCMYIIGPNESVPWSSALTAFVVYYHLNLVCHTPAQEIACHWALEKIPLGGASKDTSRSGFGWFCEKWFLLTH